MDKGSDMYNFVKTLATLRKVTSLWTKKQVQRYADDNFYAFTRDIILALFTNTDDEIYRTIDYHSYTEGTKLFNSGDCVNVSGGKINLTLHGDVKVYVVTPNLK